MTGCTLSPSPVCLTLGRLFRGREALAALLFSILLGFLSFSVVMILSPCMPCMQGVGSLTVNPFSRFFQGEPAVFGSVDTYPVNIRKMEDGSGLSNSSDKATPWVFLLGGYFFARYASRSSSPHLRRTKTVTHRFSGCVVFFLRYLDQSLSLS